MDRILDSGSNDWGSTPHGDTQKDLLSQTAGPFFGWCQLFQLTMSIGQMSNKQKCRGDRTGRSVQSLLNPSLLGQYNCQSNVGGPGVIGPGDQTGRPYIGCVDVSELRFDKMSNEGSESANPRTKIRFGGFRGILRRFAKCRLLLYGEFSFLSECVVGEEGDFCYSYSSSSPLFITFRFVDNTFLLENETRFFLLPFSKDLTSGHETKVFGG